MPIYRKRPVIVEAHQYRGDNRKFIIDWIGRDRVTHQGVDDGGAVHELANLRIATPEGEMTARLGDYVIKGVAGEFYPCKPDVFEETYEIVS